MKANKKVVHPDLEFYYAQKRVYANLADKAISKAREYAAKISEIDEEIRKIKEEVWQG